MRPLHSFHLARHLPESLRSLELIVSNLRWSWDRQSQDLLRWIEPELWEATDHNAFQLLDRVSAERLQELALDSRFTEFLKKVASDLHSNLSSDSWYQAQSFDIGTVAYFSPEFGIASAVPQYSGGLGVLAGDHLKSSSALGVPLVGIGLFYKEGYFRQGISPRGTQFERYPSLDPLSLGLTQATEDFTMKVSSKDLSVRVWKALVGRVTLYLLDTDLDDNDPDLRSITDRLYGGDNEHRLRQEIVLGMGGVHALDALGIAPSVFHSNEGHAGLMGLQRLSEFLKSGRSFNEAVESVRASTVFTTHTPVPAGIDRFPYELMNTYFSEWASECGLDLATIMNLGHLVGEAVEAPFNMAVMGLRLSSIANGVSKLHGDVSRELFSGVWPALDVEQVPITHVTNGVHPTTWVSSEVAELFSSTIHPNWANGSPDEWRRIDSVPSETLWQIRDAQRARMIPEIRRRLRSALMSSGWEEADLSWCDTVLDPKVLTIGFARRFAPYKRADLLLSQVDRLSMLCGDLDRPVQFIFAGKAHPADDPGKDLVRRVFEFSYSSGARGRFVFVPDYDMALARTMYQGVDIWLNTPTRPLEASGTSGMKAALNGCLNLSILDGWWAECYNGDNGWAISSAPSEFQDDERRRLEADNLFELIENSCIPEFYERPENSATDRWIQRVKASLSSLGPYVTGQRMVREYVERIYLPTFQRRQLLEKNEHRGITEIVQWRKRVTEAWPNTKVASVERSVESAEADGGQIKNLVTLTVAVHSPTLLPEELLVEVVWGPLTSSGRFAIERREPAKPTPSSDQTPGGDLIFKATLPVDQQGTFGYLVSVRPDHELLANSYETGLQILY
jgi:starch phosphorylase